MSDTIRAAAIRTNIALLADLEVERKDSTYRLLDEINPMQPDKLLVAEVYWRDYLEAILAAPADLTYLQERAERAEAEVERLRAALAEYADHANWRSDDGFDDEEGNYPRYLYVGNDGHGWEPAEAALAGKEQGGG